MMFRFVHFFTEKDPFSIRFFLPETRSSSANRLILQQKISRMINIQHTLSVLGIWLLTCLAHGTQAAPVTSFERSYPLPANLNAVNRPFLSLNGAWQFRYSPGSKWSTIQVPGEAAMQGYAIEHDKPFVYKKTVTVPADYAGHAVILRFDGVYSYARLSVNGQFVREHKGGFTRWETDIAPWVKPGKKNEISVEVTDRADDISYASGYAHHPIGGILRDVTLFALPRTHLYDVSIETRLDSLYRDATLAIAACAAGHENAEVTLALTAPDGRPVPLTPATLPLEAEQTWQFHIKNPDKWDAEHPNLYTLSFSVRENGKELGSFTRKIGFRKVEIKGERMLVNGKPVKLRGACRHDIHPTLGRTSTPETDSLDAVLFKEANMNFVRTSHYPPTEKFLEYCDRYGIYVECETAVCFVNTHRQKNYAPGDTQDNPDFTDQYAGQCREMVKSFRSHPSILLWSIGNESKYGSNFQQCWDWIKATDPTRPVIFSYPGSQDKNAAKIYDILSMHYQDVHGNLNQWGMSTRGFQGHGIPALFDEWAHPACYTYATLQHDPNIREFWGKSLDLMWSGLFNAPGGLGGAIWGYVDETFMLPEPRTGTPFWKEFARTAKPADYQGNCVGYGEWGIVDVWRREKPEFWSTKKAYSPVRLLVNELPDFTAGQPLSLPVHNRFDHTYLNEIRANYTYKGSRKSFPLPATAPHQKGILQIPAEEWNEGEPLVIEFFSAEGKLIDAYRLPLGTEKVVFPEIPAGDALSVEETDTLLIVRGRGFEVPFHKETGLITGAKAGNNLLIEKGPFLHLYVNLNHLTGAEIRKTADHFAVSENDWKKTSFDYRLQPDGVYAELSGTYRQVEVDFRIKVTPQGQLSINYFTTGVPNGFLRETGLSFHLPDGMERLDWKRKGYWNYYPENAFAGNEGSVSLYNAGRPAYGERPAQPWALDTHNYYYWADAGAPCRKPLTQQAKGMKENIYYYTLSVAGTCPNSLSVYSPGATVACRIDKQADELLMLYANNRWDYPEIAWGNYCKTLEAVPCFGTIRLVLK